VYDDDIDMNMGEDDSSPQEGHAGEGEEGAGCSFAPPKRMFEPPMTRSRGAVGCSGFDEAHFDQYIGDHFSHFNLRLNTIDEHQQQHAQAQQKLHCRQMKFERRQQNLEHNVYYVYEHHSWPYPPPDWRPSGPY